MIDTLSTRLPAAANGCLYEQVAQRIARLIDEGTLRPGDRIPSVRKSCAQQDVSVATVLQAYRLLESRGLIQARPQSGYYVRARRWTPPPEPEISTPPRGTSRVEVNELVMRIIHDNLDSSLVRLGATCSNVAHYPVHQLHRILSSTARRSGVQGMTCDCTPGLGSLRVQVARHAIEAGCTLSPGEIVTTCGATEGVHLCLRAVANPGDAIAIESPTYFGILQLIESLGMRAVEIPTYPRDGVCLDELESALKRHRIKACLFVLNYNNPLGSCMPDEKKERLVRMLAEREIPLIENDVYGDMTFSATRPKAAKAFDRKGLVLLCNSFNKTLAPGYRVGWAASGRFHARVEHLKFVTSNATASLPQMAVAEYLATGGYEHHLRKLRRAMSEQVACMTEAVSRYFPPGTKATRPAGGQVIWVELPAGTDSLEVYQRALRSRIAIAPGHIFSAKQNFQNFIRLNCGNPWSEIFEKAVQRLGQIIHELAPE
jgi:DNA-binding transcriptional MocR family regulator